MQSHNVLTPNTFPFSPANASTLLNSSPHTGAKAGKSPYGTSKSPYNTSLSNLHLLGPTPNFDSPSGNTGAKYLANYLAATGTDVNSLAISAGVGGMVGVGVVGVGAGQDPKKRKFEEVMKTLKSRPGRIGEDGVERLAKRAKMEFYRDDTSQKGLHMLSISGTIVVVDIDFTTSNSSTTSNFVSRVGLSFAETPGPASDLAYKAAAILQKTLTITPPCTPLTSSLSQFADNIDRLARLDRLSNLSSTPVLNCFSLIADLYTSLRTEWDKEVSLLSEREALCKGNGRPGMHERGKVGLGVDYWMERSLVPAKSPPPPTTATEVDDAEGGSKIWRVIIELEEQPSNGYMQPTQPTTTNWNGGTGDGMKSDDDAMFDDLAAGNDWGAPQGSSLGRGIDTLMGDTQTSNPAPTQQPLLQFIARLDPPVIISLRDELEIFGAAGIALLPTSLPASLDQLLYPRAEDAQLKKERLVYMGDGERREQVYTLHDLRPCYGRILQEIPFSDPKQLWKIFQILRKYALFTSLFQSAFGIPSMPPTSADSKVKTSEPSTPPEPEEDSLDAFFSDEPTKGPTGVNVSLADTPLGISLVVPTVSGATQVEIQVGGNGDLVVNCGSGSGSGNGDVGKVTETTEDLGILVEYLRMKGV